ncbi:hypothetical protein DSM25559_4140 [Agrobacterium rosae]|uniref:Uncharacterized protein n=1 Tax=Agrobacterium rosae TaxID=1972867 RepID=A0A1R3U1P1_9HYPH|nr:hypothetical protein DSM25559_4140 [Agrobacterium rosae]
MIRLEQYDRGHANAEPTTNTKPKTYLHLRVFLGSRVKQATGAERRVNGEAWFEVKPFIREIFTVAGGAYPPLSCRTSPPQVGRSNRGTLAAILDVETEAASVRPADLPPCGGDARQGRGG